MDAERLRRMDELIESGRIIRHAWTGQTPEGRETACLLAALSPEAGESASASACPTAVMSRPLAYLTPWMDDSVSEAMWPVLVRRYGALAHRWHVLSTQDWASLDRQWRVAIVREARSHVGAEHPRVLAAIDGVLAVLANPKADKAEAAAEAAEEAAEEAARWAAAVEEEAARWAAADRIATAILDALERAIVAREEVAHAGR